MTCSQLQTEQLDNIGNVFYPSLLCTECSLQEDFMFFPSNLPPLLLIIVWPLSKYVIIFLLTGNGAGEIQSCRVSSATLHCTKHNLQWLVDCILTPFNLNILNRLWPKTSGLHTTLKVEWKIIKKCSIFFPLKGLIGRHQNDRAVLNLKLFAIIVVKSHHKATPVFLAMLALTPGSQSPTLVRLEQKIYNRNKKCGSECIFLYLFRKKNIPPYAGWTCTDVSAS